MRNDTQKGLIYRALVWALKRSKATREGKRRAADYYGHRLERIRLVLEDVGPPGWTDVERVLHLRKRVHELEAATKLGVEALEEVRRVLGDFRGYRRCPVCAIGYSPAEAPCPYCEAGRLAELERKERGELHDINNVLREDLDGLLRIVEKQTRLLNEVWKALEPCRGPWTRKSWAAPGERSVSSLGAVAVAELIGRFEAHRAEGCRELETLHRDTFAALQKAAEEGNGNAQH